VKGNRARVAAWVAFAAFAVVIFSGVNNSGVAHAQNLGQRNVGGLVIDANSAAVQGATVFLKNTKTKSIRSYTSASNGSFRFAQVNMTDDYDLWAEKDGKKSPTKTVSSWDARKDFETELKLK
jgi:hypothetical protein